MAIVLDSTDRKHFHHCRKLYRTTVRENNGQTNSETLEFLCARHCSKLLECITSFNSHCGSMSHIGLLPVPIS